MTVPSRRPARQLTAPQVLLIGVVGALVLLLVVLLVQRATGGGAPDLRGATAATATATGGADGVTAPTGEAPQPGATGAEPTYFASPSGNIACSITVDSADCVIASFGYEPADAQHCEDDAAGGHLRVEPAGASMPCDPLVVAGDVPALAYGESVAAHGFTCQSDESGVSCRHDDSGYGFSVARAGYDLF